MDAALFAVAQSQDGLFTTAQAHAAGLTDAGLAGLKKQRTVSSVARSVYALSDAVPTDPTDLHRMRVAASLLIYPDARPCGVSLLTTVGVDVWGAAVDRVDLVRPVTSEVLTQLCRIRSPHLGVRPWFDAPLPVPVGSDGSVGPSGPSAPDPDAARVVAAAVGQTALDHGALPGIVSADDALQDRRTTMAAIVEAASTVRHWPAAGRVRTMLALMDGRSQSVGESRLRVMLTIAGLHLIPQFPIREEDADDPFAFADLLVDGTNLLLEFDGRIKDGGPDALWREKKREDRIRRCGYRVDRVIWADLERPKVLLARIRHEVQMSQTRPSIARSDTASGA